jgi:hypothetical protein
MKKNFVYLIKAWIISFLFILPGVSIAQEIILKPSYYAGGYNITCHGGADGSIEVIIVDGAGPFLYNWSNGSFLKNQSGLVAGAYTLTVTDINGSTFTSPIELIEPKNLEVILEPLIVEGGYNISSYGGQDGFIAAGIVGGVPPYTYLWSNGGTGNKIAELVAGTYSLIVTGTNGCTATSSVTLTQPSPLQILSITSPLRNGYNTSCYEIKDGEIDVTVIGGTPPYSFQWQDGFTTEDRAELPPGIYSVIVRDANEVGDAAQIQLTGPSRIEVELTPYVYSSNGKNVSCFGCSNGSISSVVSGGAAPYTYVWDNGTSNSSSGNLGVGEHVVSVFDANSCKVNASISLVGPEREDWTMTGNVGTNPGANFIGTTDNKDVIFKTNNVERLRINGSGQIEIKNNLKIDSLSSDSLRSVYVDSQGLLKVSSGSGGQQPCTSPTNRWVTNYCTSGNDIYNLPNSGNVGIGTSQIPAGYKLAVDGKIICEEVKVKLSSNWPDYVFKHDYKLMPLSELKKFINDKNHLPDIPSADEVEMEGNSIGDMQSKLLLKIEELTLYLVQQHEKLEKLENENIVLNKKLDVLSAKEMK